MPHLENVHLAGEEDLYSGFNDYNPVLDPEALVNDPGFQQAVAKTSHGRRPTTGRAPGTAFGARLGTGARMGTAARGRTAVGTARPGTASQGGAARPMTAVRGAGYTSHGGAPGGVFDPLNAGLPATSEAKLEDNPEEKCRVMEQKVNENLEESIFAYSNGDYKVALEKAKEAGKRERAVVKLREQLNLVDQMNLDLTFTVCSST